MLVFNFSLYKLDLNISLEQVERLTIKVIKLLEGLITSNLY